MLLYYVIIGLLHVISCYIIELGCYILFMFIILMSYYPILEDSHNPFLDILITSVYIYNYIYMR